MTQQEEMVRLTIAVPATLRALLKTSAKENDRSFSGEIVHCLKRGSGWLSDQEAAGGDLAGQSPAAETTQKDGQEAA